MAANNLVIYPAAPIISTATVSSALTTRTVTGTTGLTQLVPSSTNGTRVDSIKVVSNAPIGTANSANVVRVWVYSGSGNAALFDEYTISVAGAPSATAAGVLALTNYVYPTNQLALPAGYSLWVSIHTYAGTQDGYNIIAFGGTY